jgi:lipopolysaccharide/colanic/teichoic acid biosynthesis glycosyltransferase
MSLIRAPAAPRWRTTNLGRAGAGYARRFRARPGLTGYAAVCGFRGEVKELQAIIDRVDADNRVHRHLVVRPST